MTGGRGALVALVLLAATAGCGPDRGSDGSPIEEDRVIAQVDGEPVARGLFEAYLRDNLSLTDESPRGSDPVTAPADGAHVSGLTDEVQSRLLDRFLLEQALLVEARRAGIEASEAEIDAFSQKMGLGPLAGLHEGAPITEREYLRKYLEDCYLVKTFLDRVVLQDARSSESEAQAYYAAHASQFSRPDSYRLRHIRVDSLPEAQRLRQALVRDPSSFAEVARTMSEGTEGEQGKDLGQWPADELPEPVAEAVAGIAPGQVTDVVEDPSGGFSIYYLAAKLEGGTAPFEQVRERILTKLERDRRGEVLVGHLLGLPSRVRIERVEENLGFLYREGGAVAAPAAPSARPDGVPTEPASPANGGAT